MTKNVLVVGCGSIGERHLRCFLKTGRAQLNACETNPALLQKIQQAHKVPCFASLPAVLASQTFDGVIICTPAHTHIGIALTALRAGSGLLIEKPLSTSPDISHVD